MTLTAAQLHELLSHPDPTVRSLADWTREYRGFGTRGLSGDRYSADATRLERRLTERLAELEHGFIVNLAAFEKLNRPSEVNFLTGCALDSRAYARDYAALQNDLNS